VKVFRQFNNCPSLIPMQFCALRCRCGCRSVDKFETNWTATVT
jgi:hypothetical protein